MDVKKQPLTDRQKEVLDWISTYQKAHGYAPLLQDIATMFSVKTQSVRPVIKQLELKGYIKRYPHKHRGLELL